MTNGLLIDIRSSYEIADSFDKSLDGVKFDYNDKNIISTSFYSLALEHQRSIIVLVEKKLYGSASTLLRSLFEAYVKGKWFYCCAKKKDFNNLKNDNFRKQFQSLIDDIEEKDKNKGLTKQKDKNWKSLNSFTHAGIKQINKRSSEIEITSNYNNEFIADVLLFANNYALLSASEIAAISNNLVAQKCVLKISKRLNKNKHNK